jgi:predicted lipoprotein with Yx(FWY)xxD motif
VNRPPRGDVFLVETKEVPMHKLLALGALLAFSLSACGGATSTGSSGSSSGAAPSSTGAVLSTMNTSLGKVLVDGSGRTVYLLTSDAPHHSNCDASCLAYWPAVTAKTVPHRLPGISAPIATTAVSVGGKTLTVGRWPVYTFAQDAAPGDVKGEGVKSFGGVWWAISPSGQPVKASAPSSSSSSGGSQGGY